MHSAGDVSTNLSLSVAYGSKFWHTINIVERTAKVLERGLETY